MYFEIKDGRIIFYKVEVDIQKLNELKKRIVLDFGVRSKVHKEELESWQVEQERNQENAITVDFKEILTDEAEVWVGSHTSWIKKYTIDYTKVKYPNFAKVIEAFETSKYKNLVSLITLLNEETTEKTISYINEVYSCINLVEVKSLDYKLEDFFTLLINSEDNNLSNAASYIDSHSVKDSITERIRRL